jgi:transposase-like protein
MEMDSRSGWQGKGALEELMRERIRATIETIVEEELEGALGAARSQRVGSVRVGYRHGKRARTLPTSLGATTITMPRARIEDAQGQSREWHSRMIPRYQRRTERVDEAILGVYLSGTNTRRIRGALAPLLRGAPLSKDAVSRLVGRLREDFEAWEQRDLGELKIPLPVPGRLVSAGTDWEKACAGASAGHAGRLRQRPPSRARPAAGRRRE